MPTSLPILVDAHPTKSQIVRARLLTYYGSPPAALCIAAGLALPLVYRFLAIQAPFQLWLISAIPIAFLPLGIALAGLWSPQIEILCEQGLRYRLSDAGLDVSGPAGDATLRWSHFKRWFELRDVFVVCSGLTLVLLPKSAVAAPDDLRDLLSRRVRKS